MNSFISDECLAQLRKQFPAGSRVELVKMDDPQAPPVGTKGTVYGVDDIGNNTMPAMTALFVLLGEMTV